MPLEGRTPLGQGKTPGNVQATAQPHSEERSLRSLPKSEIGSYSSWLSGRRFPSPRGEVRHHEEDTGAPIVLALRMATDIVDARVKPGPYPGL